MGGRICPTPCRRCAGRTCGSATATRRCRPGPAGSCSRGARRKPKPSGQHLEDAFREDAARFSRRARLQDLEDQLLLAHAGRARHVEPLGDLGERADAHVLERGQIDAFYFSGAAPRAFRQSAVAFGARLRCGCAWFAAAAVVRQVVYQCPQFVQSFARDRRNRQHGMFKHGFEVASSRGSARPRDELVDLGQTTMAASSTVSRSQAHACRDHSRDRDVCESTRSNAARNFLQLAPMPAAASHGPAWPRALKYSPISWANSRPPRAKPYPGRSHEVERRRGCLARPGRCSRAGSCRVPRWSARPAAGPGRVDQARLGRRSTDPPDAISASPSRWQAARARSAGDEPGFNLQIAHLAYG